MRTNYVTFLLVLSFSLNPFAANATTFVSKGFDELAAGAEQIFIGTATTAKSRRTALGTIVTDYVFDDIDVVKGVVPATHVSIMMLGGTLEDESLEIGGAPTFRSGTRYLLFVAGNGSVIFPLVGGPQGIFQIYSDASTGRLSVRDYGGRPVTELRSGAGVVLKRAATSDARDATASSNLAPMSLEVFLDEIRRQLVR